LSKVKDKENFESSKGKVTCHMQGKLIKTINGFSNRNLVGELEGSITIVSDERKRKLIKILYSAKLPSEMKR
jgi:hypothetical protein